MAKLTKSNSDKKLCGVCGGLAKHLDIDVTLLRILWILVTLFTGFIMGIIAYLVCALVMPEE